MPYSWHTVSPLYFRRPLYNLSPKNHISSFACFSSMCHKFGEVYESVQAHVILECFTIATLFISLWANVNKNCFLSQNCVKVQYCSSPLPKLQCAPHQLRPLIFIIASSTEIAVTWNFSCVCGLPLCWCWRFFIILKQQILYGELSFEKNKTLAT